MESKRGKTEVLDVDILGDMEVVWCELQILLTPVHICNVFRGHRHMHIHVFFTTEKKNGGLN